MFTERSQDQQVGKNSTTESPYSTTSHNGPTMQTDTNNFLVKALLLQHY